MIANGPESNVRLCGVSPKVEDIRSGAVAGGTRMGKTVVLRVENCGVPQLNVNRHCEEPPATKQSSTRQKKDCFVKPRNDNRRPCILEAKVEIFR
jgi:hypothetical protein